MNIKIKKAKAQDKNFILNTRNENSKNLFNQSLISKKNHYTWYKKKLTTADSLLLIIYFNEKRCGYIRYDFKDFFAEISIVIKKKYHGMGIGTNALMESEKKLKKELILISKIKSNNIKSIKIFESNEYRELSSQKKEKTFYKIHKRMKKNKYIEIINKIEKIRSKNNVNWMDILRLSFEKSPYKAKNIFKQIMLDDKKISKLSKILSK
jgi:RimJ/RimL family protein N-acetyltransferase|tara:strand:- start:628 stop:1254 length:627 start_codon:yes stop_codon:yes gene_type:complete